MLLPQFFIRIFKIIRKMKQKFYYLIRVSAYEGVKVETFDKYANAITQMNHYFGRDLYIYDKQCFAHKGKWGYTMNNAQGKFTKTKLLKVR